jgi:hypothetical protein
MLQTALIQKYLVLGMCDQSSIGVPVPVEAQQTVQAQGQQCLAGDPPLLRVGPLGTLTQLTLKLFVRFCG